MLVLIFLYQKNLVEFAFLNSLLFDSFHVTFSSFSRRRIKGTDTSMLSFSLFHLFFRCCTDLISMLCSQFAQLYAISGFDFLALHVKRSCFRYNFDDLLLLN